MRHIYACARIYDEYGIFTDDYYYEEAKRLYNEGVFDYIELYVVPETLDTLESWKKLNIPFIIHCPHFAHGFNLAKSEKRESNLNIYNQVKHFADELNAKYIIFHGGVEGDIKETAKQLKSFNECRALIENKPFAALPNTMGGKFCRGATLEEIGIVIDAVGCGFCLDFGHAICSANSQNIDVYDYCEKFLKFKPKMFHLTDVSDISSGYDTHLHLGKGQLDFSKILQMLSEDDIITIETIKNDKKNLEDFVEDIRWLKNL